jgi:hypothetical protein
MGSEVSCLVRFNQIESFGKAHCSDGEISFRGDFRFLWKWTDLSTVEVVAGHLVIRKGNDEAILELGQNAEKWCQAIRNPKSRLDKLGLKPSHAYQAWGDFDDLFLNELDERAGAPGAEPLDVIFIRMDSTLDLQKLTEARKVISQNGMIWTMWPKGRKEFREDDIRNYSLQNGLVDVKVASFSPILSALKMVIPVKDRI